MSEYRVQFEVFEGPLDLLLHLVKKQEVDIYQVNLTRIATEFVAYLEQMRELDLEVAGEFVVMAATLLYIKSRELLPVEKQVVPATEDEDEDDPRWELIRRLVEYKKFKDAAALLQGHETRMDSVYEHRSGRVDLTPVEPARADAVSVFDLVSAVSVILRRFHLRTDVGEIHADPYTVSEKIDYLRQLVSSRPRFNFGELFEAAVTRTEVVVTFLALLELIRLKVLVCVQSEDFGSIEIEPAPAPVVVAVAVPDDAPAADPPPATDRSAAAGPVTESPDVPDRWPPGATPPADIVTPVEPRPPGTLPGSTPFADGADGPIPA